ncbi:acyltransferase family protein [Paenibacillus silviterrae]|uniref:acyltransferase family protein n=1 Tax=Paenibacillus silviterrae TaxID=3242194 RepID=UPI0025429B42|nr:acyltransferase [Paenibacillus chinjuensis]
MTRSGLIDFLRGWAILGVITIHVLLLVPKEGISEEMLYLAHWGDLLFRFAVPFFIAILGFMTYEKYRHTQSWLSFYRKKLLYVAIPFLLWSWLYTGAPDIFTDYLDYVRQDAAGILLGYAEIHLYFMIVYLGFIVLTPLVVGLFRILPSSSHPLLAWGLLLVHLVVLYQVEADIFAGRFDTFYIQTESHLPLHWFGYYAAGMLLSMTRSQLLSWLQRHRARIMLLGALLIPLYLVLIDSMVEMQVYLYIYHTPVLYISSGLALLLLSWLYAWVGQRWARWIEWLGRYSFAVYLSHVLWIIGGWLLAGQMELSLPWAIGFTWIVALAGSVLYIPIHRWIGGYAAKFERKSAQSSKDIAQGTD